MNIYEVVDLYNNKFENIKAISESLIKEMVNNEMNQFKKINIIIKKKLLKRNLRKSDT